MTIWARFIFLALRSSILGYTMYVCNSVSSHFMQQMCHTLGKKEALKAFLRTHVMTNNLQITTMLASLETTSPIPLLAEHRYRPASSLVTSVKRSNREFSPLTNPSVISTALPSCLHVITDAGLLDTLQFSQPDCASVICTSAVSIVGPSFQQSHLDNREQRIPKV